MQHQLDRVAQAAPGERHRTLRNASLLIGSGLFAGLACTWIVTRVLKSFLFGVSEHDPLTVFSVSLLLIVCGLVAAFVPARRAASIDPIQALRTE